MKKITMIYGCCVALVVAPSLAGAEAPTAKERVYNRVSQGLVQALKKRDNERSSFSRSVQAPQERRVRVLQDKMSRDDKGRTFLAYAVDVRYGNRWHEDITGCVYTQSGNIYVQIGDEYRSHEYLLGEDVPAVSGVCATPPSKDNS